jgi:hypothetical protein
VRPHKTTTEKQSIVENAAGDQPSRAGVDRDRLDLDLLVCKRGHPLRVALAVEVAGLQHPRLGAELGAEVVVVRDLGEI